MSKKSYVDVLGFKKGSKPEVVATFSNRPLANWHIKNTLEGKGYDQLMVRNTGKKGTDFVNDVVAEDKGTYVRTEAFMRITDLDTVTTTNKTGTLLGFILDGDIKSKTGLNKLEVNTAEGDEDDVVLSVVTVYDETESTNLGRIKTRLSKELLDTFLGTGNEDDEEEVEDDEEVVEEDEEVEEDDEEEVEEEVELDEDEEELEEVAEDEEYEVVEEEEVEEEVEEDEDIDEEDLEELDDLDI